MASKESWTSTRRERRVKGLTIRFLCRGAARGYPESEAVVGWPVSSPIISGAKSWAIWRTSLTLRVAKGLGMTTIRAPGMPSDAVRARAARVKALVMTLTDGTPLDSVTTVSWRPHAVQEPQSAIPWIMASHSAVSSSSVSPAHGELKLNLVAYTTFLAP